MKHQLLRCALVAAVAWGLPIAASAGDLKVSMHDGRVTIVADNVSLRQILDEWARVGQTKIVNADRVSGPLVTLQLVDVPEREALDTILRSASGYIAAPRPVAMANASVYDRVTIMPISHAPAVSASAITAPPPAFQRPMPSDDEDTPVNMMMQPGMQPQPQPQNSPVLMPYPGMQPPGAGQQPPASGFQPPGTSPLPGPVMTSPRPGALPAQQPGAPNPYQPIVRPVGPGGGGGGN